MRPVRAVRRACVPRGTVRHSPRFAGRAALQRGAGQAAVAVVRVDPGGRAFVQALWGFNLRRADGRASVLINARSESAAAKPAFQDSFRRRRCLVPADGFYEWSPGPAKRPYFIHRGDRRCLALAGLWRVERGRDGQERPHFTLLTREADAALQRIHDRMPVIVPRDAFASWLDGAARDAGDLLARLPEAPLVATPVGRRVNDPGHDDPGCIAPLDDGDGAGPPPRLPGL